MQKILTWHPLGKPGFYLPEKDYDVVRNFILSALGSTQMSLVELIALGERQLAGQIKDKIGWHILVVKLDLEARGIVVSFLKPLPFRSQCLKLNRRIARQILLNGAGSIANQQSVK